MGVVPAERALCHCMLWIQEVCTGSRGGWSEEIHCALLKIKSKQAQVIFQAESNTWTVMGRGKEYTFAPMHTQMSGQGDIIQEAEQCAGQGGALQHDHLVWFTAQHLES